MKQKSLCSIILFLPIICLAQKAEFKISPYANMITSVRDGLLEAGPEFNWKNISKGKEFALRPSFRMPLTSKSDNILQIDRFSSTWRGILAGKYIFDSTKPTGRMSRHSIIGQIEYGHSVFKYYPTGKKDNEQKTSNSSYSFEIKYIGFFTKGRPGAKQLSPQFRLRYSYDWKASSEVGVVNAPNNNGVVTTTNMIVDGPGVKPILSPAFSLQLYLGKGNFSFSPTIYYEFIGKKGNKNPFNDVNRLRLESWFFFFPQIKDIPNVKMGITPFVNIRTKGMDDLNKVEYGCMITVRFGASFKDFF